jgi:putative drug exporter of the RND superfamily
MMRSANIAIRRPKAAILIWLVLVGGLALAGQQLEHRFSPSVITAKGTESARAAKLAKGTFGDGTLMPIMLVGPARQLDRQGPALVRALRTRSDTRVLAPWDGTPGSSSLRPKPTAATIVASIQGSEKKAISTSLPQIEKTVHAKISGPVAAHVTGQATIDRAMRDEALSTTRTAVLVALGLVLVLLLLVLRSFTGAGAIAVLGATVLPIGYGLLAVVATVIPVDAIAAPAAAIVGLSLSVGFGIVIVQRFREELAGGAAAARASERAAATAGRTVALGGTAVVLMMLLATSLSQTEILNSVGIGATIMAAIATLGAVVLLPGALRLLGTRVHPSVAGPGPRGRLRRPGRAQKVLVPLVAAAGALGLMAALSAPVLHLHSGSPDPKMLPADNGARKDYEAVAAVMGAGWVSPYEIVITNHGGAVTTRKMLAQINGFERRIGRDHAVASVVGPGALAANAEQLQGVPKGLKTSAKTAEKSKKDLKKLIAGLHLATNGVAQLKSGLGSAASGASQLHGGSGQLSSGASQLSAGLTKANSGAQQLKAGSAKAAAGARELAAGLGTAEKGVSGGLPAERKIGASVKSSASDIAALAGPAQAAQVDVAKAAGELGAAANDPHVAAALAALREATNATGQLTAGISTASQRAAANSAAMGLIDAQIVQLLGGLKKLHNGADDLSAGLKDLSGGNSDLASGLSQLDAGAGQLAAGLTQLDTGAGQLASGLGAGTGPSGQLLSGMNTITGSVEKSRKGIPSTKDLQKLQAQAPHLFDSGYYVLAALDGAPIASRDAASFVVSVGNGGLAGRITVVPKAGVDRAATRALRDRLSAATARFTRATGTQAAVGGTAASLVDYRRVAADDLPVVIGGLLLFTFAFLALVIRSVILPAIAVLLNALTATAAFGVLATLFSGSDPVLGGPGFIDPVTVIAILTVLLGLSIDYELVLMTRVREITETGVDAPAATRLGLRRTSTLVAGVGLAMVAVVVAFIPSPVTIVRELAIGMLVAIVVDAAVVRPILLPAAMRVLGRTAWWFPGWLDRKLPRPHYESPRQAVRSGS